MSFQVWIKVRLEVRIIATNIIIMYKSNTSKN